MELNNPEVATSKKVFSVPKKLTFEKRLTVILAGDDEEYCAHCPELDLVTEPGNRDGYCRGSPGGYHRGAGKTMLRNNMADIRLYSNSPNRAHHLPYIKEIAACKNDWEIKMLLEVQYGLVHV